MSWEALGAIGELVGGLAVVLSLVYLAVQVRQNTRQLAESSREARLAGVDATLQSFSRFRQIASQPAVAEVYARGCEDYSGLTAGEQVQFRAIIEELFFSYQALFERMQASAFDNEAWQQQGQVLGELLIRPGVAQWWRSRRSVFDPEFAGALQQFSEAAPQRDQGAA